MSLPLASRPLPPSLGPFRLITRLGQGGFAPVWRAEEVYEGKRLRDVAVKLFSLPDGIPRASPEAARWYAHVIEEARALCRVEHPGVVRFYTLCRDDVQGIVGLVMEHVVGDNLGDVLEKSGPLPEPKVLEIGASVAWALAAVHDAGLVHRDVKPENIIAGATGYKLIDFGIVVDAPRAGAAPAAYLAGTPGFIPPEYLCGGLPSPAGDLYALGATLFVLATGSLPRVAGGASKPAHARRNPDSLLDLAALLLDPDPHARPRHAAWLAREIERIRSSLEAPLVSRASPAPGSMVMAAKALLERRRGFPEPLAPLLIEALRACSRDSAADASAALRELGLGVLRYAFSLGMALLTDLPARAIPDALAAQIRGAAQSLHASWSSLLRALHDALAALAPPLAPLFKFAHGPTLAALDLLLAEPTPVAPGVWAPRILALQQAAADLLALPLAGDADTDTAAHHETRETDHTQPDAFAVHHVLAGGRRVRLDPWLPHAGDHVLLPELPATPGKAWRAVDPFSGERRDDPRLDLALARLVGEEPKGGDTAFVLDLHPPLVGRADALATLAQLAVEAQQGAVRVALISGPIGIGRTRLLDAAVADLGAAARTLRVHASPERRSPFGALLAGLRELPDRAAGAFRLLERAIGRALLPAVVPSSHQSDDALEAVEGALLHAAAEHLVILAVDDVQWADERTQKLLHLLVERAERGARAKLFVLATARDEPNASASLRALLGAVHRGARQGVKHVALAPLTAEEAAALARSVCPVDLPVERAVVRGSGGVPFFVVNALRGWSETGAIVQQNGVFRAADERILTGDVPGVAALVEARLATYFTPQSPLWRAALPALALVALYGGGLPLDVLLRAAGSNDSVVVEDALEALTQAGILVIAGEQPEYGFAQEMVRQAILNFVRPRPWFYRVHRALLDAIAETPGAAKEAAFLGLGYDKLGEVDEARRWLERAMDSAVNAGLFGEAVDLGDRLGALSPDAATRADVEIAVVRALVLGRRLEEAKERLARHEPRAASCADPRVFAQEIRVRILRLEVARGRAEAAEDEALLTDADALGDPALRCEARIAVASVGPKDEAMALLGEAIALAEGLPRALEFSARVLRAERSYDADLHDLQQAEHDLRRALAIAHATSSIWQEVHIGGDLAVLKAERDPGAAIEHLQRLVKDAEEGGMAGQLRILLNNLAVCLMREGRATEAAEVANRTAILAAEAGDPKLGGNALSLCAYALFRSGQIAAALTSANAAERLQRERDDPLRAHTLLRRALILEAMGQAEEALGDARAGRESAEHHGERGVFMTAVLWEKLHLARRGEAGADDVRQALDAVGASGVTQRMDTRWLIQQATLWLTSRIPPLPS